MAMKKNRDQTIEELSGQMGGRFKLTTLIIKRIREYYQAGGTFMPKVRNQDELLDRVLGQIEKKEIALRMPGEAPAALVADNSGGGDEGGNEGSL